ncbi:MAG: hypothetical protein HY097_01155 [Nitrospinae bacterium]|nr:hypothetical protein [Nitrospinota bacterium]MBI3815319.1 hypothetical protein [Nitrospinota bacterium]
MNYKEPDAMKEIHEIRLKLYEEKKGLSAVEKANKTNQTAEDIIKEYKLKIKLIRRTRNYADAVA